jgi:hypothetical protein
VFRMRNRKYKESRPFDGNAPGPDVTERQVVNVKVLVVSSGPSSEASSRYGSETDSMQNKVRN